MANTQRRTIPSPTDLNYAFLMENIHTYNLEDEMSRWPHPPRIQPTQGPPFHSTKLTSEPLNPALLPSPVDDVIYTQAILPATLRPANNTPASIPPTFPRFPAKYTYSYTPTYVPRAVDPELIRKVSVQERALVEQSLARLIAAEGGETAPWKTGCVEGEKMEEVWWETWREMGCDLDRGVGDIWEVPKVRRRLAG
jgi:Transcription factor TFIID complex subunit 8 C-term